MSIENFANELPPVARLTNLENYLVEEDRTSPIDAFTRGIKEILSQGSEEFLQSSGYIGRLLVLAVVASAESYFRTVLSMAMELCPLSKANASEKTINLGGLLWHGHQRYSYSAFDNASFSSAQEIRKATREYISFNLDDSIFKIPLEEFDKVCQFRHGIVHGDGFLPGKNAVKLDIRQYDRPVRITIRYQQLQEVTAVVNTLVVLFNRQLFSEFCHRWAIGWRRRADWRPESEGESFSRIWAIFHSQEEWERRRDRAAINQAACLELVRNTYQLR
ncbi:hypothetical protein [Methylobacterium trifolii]|uniref:RiboL-PSP-HEPN domain-containing protein n=1 Tax=Methylobacterium trifolii TaxID=1003092 RepID=A0ABQ4U617_9HYPH|nr:hypothetical protein [Methylobacterium trifolii]GJE62741.1 hypothetical protein MPOCJGCO_4876 [Methylobacterium trifolii]